MICIALLCQISASVIYYLKLVFMKHRNTYVLIFTDDDITVEWKLCAKKTFVINKVLIGRCHLTYLRSSNLIG